MYKCYVNSIITTIVIIKENKMNHSLNIGKEVIAR